MATSTPATQTVPNGRPATPPLRAPVVVAPRGRRRPGLMVAGIALAALGALAAAWLVAQAGDRAAPSVEDQNGSARSCCAPSRTSCEAPSISAP